MDLVSAIKTFVKVAQCGSFSAAAQALNRTQPAVSRQVSALESHLDMRLLNRSTSQVALTEEGLMLLPLATELLSCAESLLEATRHRNQEAVGHVRLAAPAPFGLHLSTHLGRLLSQHPGLSVELLIQEQSPDLIGDGIDIEVRAGVVSDSDLIARCVGSTSGLLVAAPAYLARMGAPTSLEELGRHECITHRRGGYDSTWWFMTEQGPLAVPIHARLQANNAEAVHRAVLNGFGIAMLSHLTAGPDIGSGRLVQLLPEYPARRFPIHVVYHARQHVPKRIRTVVDFVIGLLGDDPAMAVDDWLLS
ncbi:MULTISPECIES: LysR family transcriptional regulator [unclassified Pseudomonas]|uniref:LysR family transcriptional regulator n=1 Tax=unclassified Pseudomonas TaxID=196821 RepID=UPI000D399794|nr:MULTISPECIES: LysR family transcriptional regulator [unclassified Pseudomonas]RAU48788.1 LysR family transcriptional regulator [Pseudomonas sp. RIT 409]RAU54351.1 LysR family transcriptional regulator [Pseudomonas sp. RIT 412]